MFAESPSVNLRQFCTIFLCLCIIFCISCEEKEPIISCGCDGTKKLELNDDPGIMVKMYDGSFDGFRFLSLHHGYLDFCESLPPDLLIDGQMVEISGTIKVPCTTSKDPLLYVQVSPFHMTTYNLPADSLFKTNPIIIHVFPSVTTQSSGFGYSVETESGFKIYQDVIPAVGGLRTFSSPTKAFKVAVLVGHKLTVNTGLPTIQIAEMAYLGVFGD